MLIQVNTDRNIEGHEALVAQVHGVVKSALSRHEDLITRVEVHNCGTSRRRRDR
jgi:hypothetical protein